MTHNYPSSPQKCVKVFGVARFRVAPCICRCDGVLSVLVMSFGLTLVGGESTLLVSHLVGVATEREDNGMTETGLVVDGVHGIYAEAIVVTMARDLGWDGPAWDLDDWERQWSVDEATEWLNEHHAGEGHSFGWHAGDFFYLSDAEWEVMV